MPVLVYHHLMHSEQLTTKTYQRSFVISTLLSTSLLVSFSSDLYAQSIDDSLSTAVESAEEAIDEAHKEASELLNIFASQLDNYFAEDIDVNKTNDTSATIQLDFSDPGDNNFSIKGKLKLRLVLPRSQRRVRLLLDVDDEDNEDNNRLSSSLPSTEEDRNLSLALRFIRKARAGASFNVDIGARRHDSKFQGFARLRASLESQNEEGWSSKVNNDYRQFYSSGYWNRLSFDFWQNILKDSDMVFRTSTSFKWENTDPGGRIDQTLGLYKELKEGSFLALEGLAGYNTSPEDNAEEYYDGHELRLRYRRKAFRPWFHFEVWPSLYWSDFNADPKFGALIRTEVRFGHTKKK